MPIVTSRHLVACAAALTLQACSAPVDIGELPGTYVFSIKTDTLHLDASGAYRRIFVRNEHDGGVSVDTGRWRLSNDGRYVALAAFPQRWPAHGRFDPQTGRWHEADTTRRGVLALEIQRTWKRELTLLAHSEFGWRYVRTASNAAASAEAR